MPKTSSKKVLQEADGFLADARSKLIYACDANQKLMGDIVYYIRMARIYINDAIEELESDGN